LAFALRFLVFGIVLFVLASHSILPKIASANELARANSCIDIPRAFSSFSVPLAVGILITQSTAHWVFVIASLSAFVALGAALRMPRFPVADRNHDSVIKRILDGGAFVLKHELLLPIAFCAIFWNLGFSALLVVMVPVLVNVYLLEPSTFGIALAAFRSAAIAGSWAAGRFSSRIAPNVILLFGPGSSVLAAVVLLFMPTGGPVAAIYGSFFLLGFGPSMWLVTQNSVRQLVTPGLLLGRVNAVIQTAIYGIRPVGALLGGAIVGATSPRTGLILVAVAYACSFACALFTRLRTVKRYADLQPVENA
jgi:predicted MFS family arabinose efflux permease